MRSWSVLKSLAHAEDIRVQEENDGSGWRGPKGFLGSELGAWAEFR